MSGALTNKAWVHREINKVAAKIANSDERLRDFWFSRFDRVQQAATDNMFSPILGDGLGLEYDESWLESPMIQDKESFIETMREIAVDAVRKSLVEQKDLFVGLIIGEARKGRSYFGGAEDSSSVPPDSLF